jgi:hypothetical protein
MKITEEHVTRALARALHVKGHDIVAIHPPGGQGPFVIPTDKSFSAKYNHRNSIDGNDNRAIDRSGIFPDVVSIDLNSGKNPILTISECKDSLESLIEDQKKFEMLASERKYLLYCLFRCKKFEGGPDSAFDFEQIAKLPTCELPIQFILSAPAEKTQVVKIANISHFTCYKFLFSEADLLYS